jgi:type IV pilus assembly protein PilA
MTTRRSSRGFTLIELMIVVAIIGILSSVAIPSLQRMQLRSKTTERALVLSAIRRSVEDVHLRDGRFPTDGGGGFSFLTCAANPAGVPGPLKKPLAGGAAGWSSLSLLVQGNVFYQYNVTAWAGPGGGNIWIWADGDLDGDTRYSSKQVGYQLSNDGWSSLLAWPPDGMEDDRHPDAASRTF